VKGITPVIAIILLLLMAVAAAGGFYFVYQSFSSSGEESGSTQIESLGETSLSQLPIESVAAGKVYVRNVGATDIDATKLTVFVDNVQYEVNLSTSTLAENSRVTFKFTTAPSCAKSKCEVKLSGAASASRSVEAARLSCSSSSDCGYGETCSSGVCATSGAAAATCGDDTCNGSEDGMTCFEDCGPRRIALHEVDPEGGDADVYAFDWNGTTYVKGENLTQTSTMNLLTELKFYSGGKIIGAGVSDYGGGDNQEILYVYYDGSSWSSGNITDNTWQDFYYSARGDINSTGEAITTWNTGSSSDTEVAWASFDGSSWSSAQNFTDWNITGLPDFKFAPDDSGMMVWYSGASSQRWMNYSEWNNGWGTQNNLTFAGSEIDWFSGGTLDFNSTGDAMLVWVANYNLGSGPEKILKYATWDGSGWTTAQNISDVFGGAFQISIVFDDIDQGILMFKKESSSLKCL